MAKSYYKHPLLANPSKWVTLPRSHNSTLYQRGFYDTESIEANIFAKVLEEKGQERLRTEYAIGNLIRLVIESNISDIENGQNTNIDKRQTTYLLPSIKPISEIIGKDRTTSDSKHIEAFPSIGHILNNKSYVKFIENKDLWRLYYPEEFRFKNDTKESGRPKIASNISEEINDLMIRQVKKLLPTMVKSNEPVKDSDQGLILILNDGKEIEMTFNGLKPIIKLGNLIEYENNDDHQDKDKDTNRDRKHDQDSDLDHNTNHQKIFIPFQENVDLCFSIISLFDYNRDSHRGSIND